MKPSEHFTLEQLADGVYAAIATEEGGGYSNAGIIDLGDRNLIFDTFETVRVGEDLKVAAAVLIDSPLACVIISHVHSDHWCGNQAFPAQASILSTHHTLDRSIGRGYTPNHLAVAVLRLASQWEQMFRA